MTNFMFFTPEDLPPEVREQMERHRMEHSETSHSVYRLLTDSDEVQSEALGHIIRACLADESNGSYFLGIMAATKAARTGECMACGVNHDKEAHDLFDAERPAAATETVEPTTDTPEPPDPAGGPVVLTPDGPVVYMQDANDPTMVRPVPVEALAPLATEGLGSRIEKMVEYHVEPVEDGDYDGTVRCTGIAGMNGPCGVTYPNLKDRMLRGPEHCSGCFARAGQG